MAVTRIWDADNARWQLVSGISVGLPLGAIVLYAGATMPAGYLLCNGTNVSRTEYSGLFAAIGTLYGAGDGSTTFKLPDLRGRFPMGKAPSGTGDTLGETGGVKDHTHTGPLHNHAVAGTTSDDGSHGHAVPDTGFMGTVTYAEPGATVPAGDHVHNPPDTHVSGVHDHTFSDTSDNDGNGATGSNNPPFQVFNYIIHASDAADIGPVGPTGPTGPPGDPGPEGIGSHVVDATEPVAPDDGLMWTDTSTGISQIWDGDGAEWIIVGTGAGGGGGGGVVVDPTEPVTPADGLIWVDPDEAGPTPITPQGVLGYAEVATNQTGITTSATTLTGLSVTFTVLAGRRVRLSAQAVMQQTGGASTINATFREGSTDIGRWARVTVASNDRILAVGSVILTPSAGVHTYTVVGSTGSGSLAVESATAPSFLLVEDIGAV